MMLVRPAYPTKKGTKPSSKGGTSDKPDASISQNACSKTRARDFNSKTNGVQSARKSGRNGARDHRPVGAIRGTFSAIDLGTNNCRLLVARPTRDGFRVIDAFSRIVRLGEGLAETGKLSEDAMDRTIEALKVCASKIEKRRVTCMRHVATEALRVADNTPAFLRRIYQKTGLNIEVISAAEEARLAVLGCQTLIAPGKRHALVFDIGGGSTELIWVRIAGAGPVEIKGWTSIPWGVVNLTETHREASLKGCPVSYQQMVDRVVSHLNDFEMAYGLRERLKDREVQFLGTSGTVTTLASLHLRLPRYDRDQIDGAWMKAEEISVLSREVAAMSESERAKQPCIGRDRSDLVVAGCAILEALLSMWPVEDLRVADRGIREGILRGLMEEKQPKVAPAVPKQQV